MSDRRYRVLIAEDDVNLRGIIAFVFGRKGFQCDTAADGKEAEVLLGRETYDAVVTDLRMPNMHGHALATSLLAMERRPVIMIHTGIIEPLLARDLLARGVDDIVFKPYDLGLLVAKVESLLERRQPIAASEEPCSGGEDAASEPPETDPDATVAAQVLSLLKADQVEASQLAAIVERDEAFAGQVMVLAKSVIYNPSGQPTVDLAQAIRRLGQRRIGEMAHALEEARTESESVASAG